MSPTLRAALLFAAGLPIALLPAVVDPRLWTAWLALALASLIALFADALATLPIRHLTLTITLPDTLYIGDRDPLTITLRTPARRRPLPIELLADLDPLLEPQPVTTATLPPTSTATPTTTTLTIPLHPRRRGTAHIDALWIRYTGPLGLIRRTHRHPINATLAIVPDIRAVREAALRLAHARDFIIGVRPRKYIGDGSSFEALEDYRPGLDHRAIDHKASARNRRLIVRRYQAERDHQIVLALDTGRLMAEALDGIPKLDRAINAGLLLAYLGLRAGDRVGLFAFDDEIRLFTEPQGAIRTLSTLQTRAAQLAYHDRETNFTLAIHHLGTRLRRRSLIVVLTDFVDPITAELMVENIENLARRHLIVFVAIRDPELDQLAEAPPATLLDLHRSVAADAHIRDRDHVLERLRRSGVFCIDAAPAAISAAMINRYLEITRREMI